MFEHPMGYKGLPYITVGHKVMIVDFPYGYFITRFDQNNTTLSSHKWPMDHLRTVPCAQELVAQFQSC
ncbi:hypothetical protein V2J09_020974 [Rumex salicifolius]